ncbi:MAG: glycosyltransferase family 2 protein [Roseburia sp.]|nr:glycosyltransferase family 2 protein [Roseburia sp.]
MVSVSEGNNAEVQNDMAQIHIVLTTYNGEKYIREQLDSLLENDFKDIYIEVCDDGSSDGTVQIVREYTERYDCIGFHQNEKNLGYTMNFMEGIRRSRSPYIMLCDQDDIWHRDKIRKTYERMKQLEQENTEKMPLMVFTDAMNFDSEDGKELGSFHKTSHLDVEKLDTAHLFMENKCIGCTIMINAEVRNYLRVLPQEIRVHDWWLALICSHFGKISYIEETTLHYRQHSGNMIGGSSYFDDIKNRLSHLHKQRAVIRATVAQGCAFYEVFGKELPEEKRETAFQFAQMSKMGILGRRKAMLQYGFCKSGLIRNVALFLLI